MELGTITLLGRKRAVPSQDSVRLGNRRHLFQVSDHGGQRQLLLTQPSQIRWLPPEQLGDGLDEHGICRLSLEATRLLQREDTFDPAIALGTGGPLGAFAPQHPKASRAFSTVIGRFHAVLSQEYPERVYLAEETADQSPGVIGPIMLLINQAAEPRIPCPPLPACRWSGGHMTQALEFCQGPYPTGQQF